MPGESAIAAEIVVDLVARPAMSGLARLHTWVAGDEVLILGPQRAGKSSFSEYLQYGILEPEQETATTISNHSTASFRLKIGRSSSLEMKVRRAVDVAGEIGPIEHARLCQERRPDAIVVLLDLAAPIGGKSKSATGPWLTSFCKHLKQRLSQSAKMRKKLRALIFVANKHDKVEKIKADGRMVTYRSIIARQLGEAFGPVADSVSVLPCVLVQSSVGTSMADAVISRLARSLAQK